MNSCAYGVLGQRKCKLRLLEGGRSQTCGNQLIDATASVQKCSFLHRQRQLHRQTIPLIQILLSGGSVRAYCILFYIDFWYLELCIRKGSFNGYQDIEINQSQIYGAKNDKSGKPKESTTQVSKGCCMNEGYMYEPLLYFYLKT